MVAGISLSGSGSSSSRKYSRGHFRGGRRGFVALNNTDSADSTTGSATTDGVPGTASLSQDHEPNRPNDYDGDGYDDDDALLTDAGDIGGASALPHSVEDTLPIRDEDGTNQESVFAAGERTFIHRARWRSGTVVC